jgi:hypothetical protein
MDFDIGALLLDHFKDFDTTHLLLSTYGYSVNRTAVYQWFYRKAVPAHWLGVLLALREVQDGAPISLTKYLR